MKAAEIEVGTDYLVRLPEKWYNLSDHNEKGVRATVLAVDSQARLVHVKHDNGEWNVERMEAAGDIYAERARATLDYYADSDAPGEWNTAQVPLTHVLRPFAGYVEALDEKAKRDAEWEAERKAAQKAEWAKRQAEQDAAKKHTLTILETLTGAEVDPNHVPQKRPGNMGYARFFSTPYDAADFDDAIVQVSVRELRAMALRYAAASLASK